VAQAKLPNSIDQVLRLLRVHRLGLTMLNCTETTIPRTGATHDEKRRCPVLETLADVRAFGLFTDCGQ
jgi:hypothetical protein